MSFVEKKKIKVTYLYIKLIVEKRSALVFICYLCIKEKTSISDTSKKNGTFLAKSADSIIIQGNL